MDKKENTLLLKQSQIMKFYKGTNYLERKTLYIGTNGVKLISKINENVLLKKMLTYLYLWEGRQFGQSRLNLTCDMDN